MSKITTFSTKLSKSFLMSEYINNNKSSTEIAQKIGCSSTTVVKYLKKYNLIKKNFKDITGKKYGDWKVIKRDSSILQKRGHRVKFICQCKCGNISSISSNSLLRHQSKNCQECANNKKLNLINKKFGKWIVLSEEPNKWNKSRWLCECECGKKTIISGSALVNNRTTRCKSCSNFTGYGDLSGRYFNKTRYGAIIRGLEFNITTEFMWNLFLKQNKKCALSGAKLILSRNPKIYSNASIDRIDSSKGYTIDNVQWVRKDINIVKGKMNNSEFIKLCNLINEYNTVK